MKVLIEKASPEKGLPLINDTVFFLGNAYLSEVDNIVRRYSGNFIRFVDDYRIFGSSKDSLELVYNNISKDLEQLGFRVNPLKTKLGTTSEYLDLISIVREGDGGYVSPMVLRGIPSDEQIIGTIGSIVEKPDLYLNEGFGRFQLGVIRRHRYNEEISSFALAAGIEELSDLLLENSSIVKKLASLLDGYSSAPDEIWRTVWLLYVGDGLKKRSKEFSQVVKRLSANPDTVPIAKLWARVRNDAPVPNLDQLHELDYLQSGALYFGERTE